MARRGDWTALRAKVDAEGRCRLCGRTDRDLDAAHVIPRSLAAGGGWTPDDVVPLCGPAVDPDTCHGLYDRFQVDLWPALTSAERDAAICAAGGRGAAYRRTAPVTWRRVYGKGANR